MHKKARLNEPVQGAQVAVWRLPIPLAPLSIRCAAHVRRRQVACVEAMRTRAEG